MKNLPEHTVPEALGGTPLDGTLRSLLATTWGKARGLIETGKVSINGAVCTDPQRVVRAGASIVINPAAPRRSKVHLPRERVVFVDPHVVVVDKPSGISTVPYEDERGTLDELVRSYLSARMGDRSKRPALGVVHRIDKETSGLVVFTRSWLGKTSLTQQFRNHTVSRKYLAIVHGTLRTQTIETHLVENRGDGLRGSAKGRHPPGAQRAVTHVTMLERIGSASLVACELETGRTHQIRIHLSEAGHPLVGERVYIRRFAGDPLPAPRQMLHAAELGFVHPSTGQAVHWVSEPPRDFQEVMARLRAAT